MSAPYHEIMERSENENSLDIGWEKVRALTNNLVMSHDMRRLYLRMLDDLKEDRIGNGYTLLGMRRAPASKERHHALEGGLVNHLLQMFIIWGGMKEVMRLFVPHTHVHLDDTTVWCAILHHDLNKIWKYKPIAGDVWKVEYGNEYDRMEQLLGSAHKSLWLLNKYGIHLSLPLHNALICSEGGFSEVRPRTETVLAKVVYLLDEFSANVIDRLQFNRFWDSKVGGIADAPPNGN